MIAEREAAPWEQQKDETTKAYIAFRIYLDMGPARTLEAAWRSQAPPEQAESWKSTSGLWNRWSSKHHWIERARAWDNHLVSIHEKAIRRGIEAEAEAQGRKWQKQREILNDKTIKGAMIVLDQAIRLVGMPVVAKTISQDGKTVVFQPLPLKDLRVGAALLLKGDAAARIAISDGLIVDEARRHGGIVQDGGASEEATRRLEVWRAEQRAKILLEPTEPQEPTTES
jgi:hypothetical protein